jgi:tellurite resistance protein TehA-like permease
MDVRLIKFFGAGNMIGNFIKQKAADLYPGYFAMVMATGALSIVTYLQEMRRFSFCLFVLNGIVYVTLWFFTIIRFIGYFPRIMRDLTHHSRGPGFFTLVAGTCIFGSQWILLADAYTLASILWGFGIFLWIVVMYTFFTAVTVRQHKPTLAEGINGAWLIAAVATQSVSILGTLLSPHAGNGKEIILFISVSMYLLGCMLYLNIITLIFYRFTFIELKYSALTPPYWINMGAVAISTLSGSNLLLYSRDWPFLVEIAPFIRGFTLFFWVAGTWWIPLLFLLTIWRHLVHRYPLNYDPQFWGMAFPLSMYTTGTFQLSKSLNIPFLLIISRFMMYVAVTAWLIGFIALIRHICDSFRKSKNGSST